MARVASHPDAAIILSRWFLQQLLVLRRENIRDVRAIVIAGIWAPKIATCRNCESGIHDGALEVASRWVGVVTWSTALDPAARGPP